MKRLAFGLIAVLAFGACGTAGTGQSNASPTAGATARASATQATTVVLTADLRAANEVPPVAAAEASCAGTVTVTLDRAANTARFESTITGCPATTAVTGAHIHEGATGANGPVRVDTTVKAGDVVFAAASGKITKGPVNVDPAVMNAMIAQPSNFYFNVHSTANGAGVIRGQLARR